MKSNSQYQASLNAKVSISSGKIIVIADSVKNKYKTIQFFKKICI